MTLQYNMDTNSNETTNTENDIDLLTNSIFDFTGTYDLPSLGVVTESKEVAGSNGLIGVNTSIIPTSEGLELRCLKNDSWMSTVAIGGVGVLNGDNATLEMTVKLEELSSSLTASIMIGWGDGRVSKQDTYPELQTYISLNLGLYIRKLSNSLTSCKRIYSASRQYTSKSYGVIGFTPLLGEFMIIRITNSSSSGGILTIINESTQEVLLNYTLGVNFNPPKGSKQLNPKFILHKNIKVIIKSLKIIR